MSQKVDAASTFCNMTSVALRGGDMGNKQLQLAMQYLLHDKLQENVASIIITSP